MYRAIPHHVLIVLRCCACTAVQGPDAQRAVWPGAWTISTTTHPGRRARSSCGRGGRYRRRDYDGDGHCRRHLGAAAAGTGPGDGHGPALAGQDQVRPHVKLRTNVGYVRMHTFMQVVPDCAGQQW